MRCVRCGSSEDRVVDSRSSKDGMAIRRRRECLGCGHRFTTYETLEHREIYVIKRDKSRQPLERAKLLSSLSKASEKRPISRETLEEAADSILGELEMLQVSEVLSSRIGLAVMRQLQSIDPVAYVRYASVYREFQDVGEFIEEIRTMHNDPMQGNHHPELFKVKEPKQTAKGTKLSSTPPITASS